MYTATQPTLPDPSGELPSAPDGGRSGARLVGPTALLLGITSALTDASTEMVAAAATMAYHAQKPFAMFGRGSFHGRQDDSLTDWRAQDGRNILILRRARPNESYYAAFFRHVALLTGRPLENLKQAALSFSFAAVGT